MGNIPPKQELIFISEFIQFTESSDNYEFELFRNFPILEGNNFIYPYSIIKGQIEIKTKNNIAKIDKKILSGKLKITEEKVLNKEKKNNYLIKYEYINLSHLSSSYLNNNSYEDLDYIPSSKIYFDIEINKPIIYSQKSTIDKKEDNYIIQYKYIGKKSNLGKNEEINLNPALFIFLIDQSGSMSGYPIKVASKALLLFLQSLPVGSYYQIIGFGLDFKKYDIEPKEYNQENIKNSIQLIKGLDAHLGGTDIYSPLVDIYNSYYIYDKINLPRNIFLLTDGAIGNKEDTLALIEKNSNKYSVYSIGIGNYFDKDLIKNAGILGKGNYNFCQNIKRLNETIATELSNATGSYIYNFNLKSSFDYKKYIYKTKSEDSENIIIKKNRIINFSYIIENKEEKENIDDKKIKIEIKYIENDRNNGEKNKEKIEIYETIPVKIPAGDELSKLIINNYILNKPNLNINEKTKLALKYQIFTEYTSLFAEVELSKSINKEMKLKIIGDKENNQIKLLIPPLKFELDTKIIDPELRFVPKRYYSSKKKGAAFPKFSLPSFDFFNTIVSPIKGLFSFGNKSKEDKEEKEGKEISEAYNINYKEDIQKEDLKEDIKDLNEKENIMNMIRTQDFIGGSWDINEQTKIIKEKYENEFELLKNLKDKNIDDKIAITILIIYFINKEHSKLLKELIMIIKKGKLFIQEKTKDSYENIIKEIGLLNFK